VWKDGGAHAWLPRREHYLELGAIGLLTFVAVVGFIVALGCVSPFNAAVLQPTIPVCTTALVVCLRMDEQPRASYAVGVGLSVCGALLVVWGTVHAKPPPPPPEPHPAVPVLLLVAGGDAGTTA
jgi:drug/metabolite transporter (DMT)-like permease